MSSIIKGERIRNQTIINLSERFKAIHIEYEKAELEDEVLEDGHSHSEHIELDGDAQEEMLLAESHQKKEEILSEAQQMAEKIIEEAKQHAEEILSGALAKAEELKEDTRNKQTQLLYETQAKSEAIIEEATKEAETIKAQAYEEKEVLIKSSEEEVTNVLQKLLSHIISEELFENTMWIKCMVKKMLYECQTKEEIKVCMAPAVFNQLTEEAKKQIEALGEKVTIETRNTLSETTCIVETKQGNIVYDVMEGFERVISEIKTLEKLS